MRLRTRALSPRMRQSLRTQRHQGRRAGSLLLPQEAPPDSLRATMAQYLEWLAVHQYSPRTVSSRAHLLQLFASWCEARSLSRPSEVTLPILERYQRHLYLYRKSNGRPLGAMTQRGQLVAVQGYFRWLTKSGHLAANPASELEMPRQPICRLPQYVLTAKEVESLLALPDVATPEGLRDRALLETLYSTGMRRMEACGLTLFSINHELGTVSIFEGKGRKDRVAPIGERALLWVQKYVDEARPKLSLPPDCGALFLTSAGAGFSPDSMSILVREYMKALGVPRGACHLLRHAMATQMLENGADVRFIQVLLGHASLQSTELYTHVSIRKLKEIHSATHPGARLLREKSSSTAASEPARASDEEISTAAGEKVELLEQLEVDAGDELDAER